jgi:CheY-like chemotaxis protein
MKTALVVEDEALLSLELKEYLEEIGFNVLQAYTGAQALAHLQESKSGDRKIDLVLLDLKLLPESGPQGRDILRALPNNIPAIICSGYHARKLVADEEIFRKARTAIRKPFKEKQIKDAVLAIFPDLTPDHYAGV